MDNGQHSHIAIWLSEWLFGICVLGATFLITTTTRALLKRLHRDRGWKILRQLAPSISNILYIVGLKIFADVAPLSGKVEIWVDNGIYILAVIIFLDLIQRAALLAIEWSSLRTNNSKTLNQGFIPLLRNVTTLFVFFTGGIMVLKHFNYDVMSLVTALGVSSLAVGLAAKDTLSNMISGFILIIDRNLKPGDRINLGGSIGDVEEIGLRSTQIRVIDGNTLIVPNAELVNTKILNLSLPSREIICSLSIRVPYDAPFPTVKNLCLTVLRKVSKIVNHKPITVNLMNLAEGHQLVQISFWISELTDASAAISEVNENILAKLKSEGIQLVSPFVPLGLSQK